MTDMSDDDGRKVLDRMKSDGFKVASKGGFKHPKAPRADLRVVHVLWKTLREAGELDRPSREGLNAFIRSRFGDAWQSVPADVDMLRDPAQIEAVIAALKAWIKREKIAFDWGRIK